MTNLHFSLALLTWIAAHRTPLLTHIFQDFTFLGDTNGYILLVTAIYVAWDKRLAVRAAALVLLTSIFNHVLKVTIKNPRPFVRQGTYLRMWAVSPADARSLAAEYSTPSGHAMCAAAFYPYLATFIDSPLFKALCILVMVMIGLSRPYLGVHYVEDVALGWAVGLALAAAAKKYEETIANWWSQIPHAFQIAGATAATVVLCAATIGVNGGRMDVQPRVLLQYAGFLTGVIVARPFEKGGTNFDPARSPHVHKLLRYLITVTLVIASIALLGKLCNYLAPEVSLVGYVLDYLRYLIAGFICIHTAPYLFTRMGLAKQLPSE